MERRSLRKSVWVLLMFLMLSLPSGTLFADQTESGQQGTKGKICTTEAESAEVMRAYLVKREAEITIPVRLKIDRTAGTDDRQEDMEKAMERIRILAFAETDKPYEGDYLRQTKGFASEAKGFWDGDVFEGTIEYDCRLMTTADQEKAVDAAVAGIMKELSLSGKSEYEKIRTIYDYICTHTTYEDGNDNSDIPYTAYSILVRRKGVCDGYSMAIYRLMREAGIGCRVISGFPKGEDVGHAWNIVRIGNLWYYVDATWDTSRYQAKLPYAFFLKGSTDRSFVEHDEYIISVRAEETDFWKVHPLSAADYPYKDSAQEAEKEPERQETPQSASKPEQKNDPGLFNVRSSPRNLKVKAGKGRSAVLTWKMTQGAGGYQIRYSLKKNMKQSRTVTIKKGSTLKKTIKNLKKKTYYFQIRAFRVLPDGTPEYGAWSPKAVRKIR